MKDNYEVVERIQEIVQLYLRQYPEETRRLEKLTAALNEGTGLLRRTTMSGHLTASAIIMSEDMQAILLIRHKVLRRWIVPGGHFEMTDGCLSETARREANEETGLQVKPISLEGGTALIDIDIHDIPKNPSKNEEAHYHFDFRYLMYANEVNSLSVESREIEDYQWIQLNEIEISDSLQHALRKLISLYQMGALNHLNM